METEVMHSSGWALDKRATRSIAAVVVSWNNYAETNACIRSLNRGSMAPSNIYVVDNGSSDGSGARLAKAWPHVIMVKSEVNLGYAGGLNLGAEAALRDGHAAILMLSNDAFLDVQCLAAFQRALDLHPGAGVFGGKIVAAEDPSTIWSVGGYVRPWLAGARYPGAGCKDGPEYEKPKAITMVSGCMLLVRGETLQRVGLMDDGFFFRGEEWDFCWRVHRAGIQLRYVPTAVAAHKANTSHSQYAPEYVYCAYRAKQRFARKHLPKAAYPVWWIALAIYSLIASPGKFSRRGSASRAALRQSLFLALKDGWRGRPYTERDVLRVRKSIGRTLEKRRELDDK